MAHTNAERVLAGEAVLTIFVAVVARIREQKTPPKPEQIAALVVVFMFLSAAAFFGNRPARVAAAIGGLITLNMLVRHSAAFFSGLSGTVNPVNVRLDDTSNVASTGLGWSSNSAGSGSVSSSDGSLPRTGTFV